jgi:hypothetical protein
MKSQRYFGCQGIKRTQQASRYYNGGSFQNPKAIEMFIEFDIELITDEPLGVLHLLQSFHIKTYNKLYINKSRIKDALHATVNKMVYNHAEAIAVKDSVKLNSAMLEQAECMLAGSKNKELIDNVLDNLWHLINESSLQPTHKQEMTSVIMNMRRDRDFGKHLRLELEHVLNQLVSVFSTDDEQHEELAAMMASDEPYVVRTGYRPTPSNQNSTDTQTLAQFQDTLDKILRMVCDVKSELGNVCESSNHDPSKTIDASVQRRKRFGQRTNDKSDKRHKPRRFANVAIQKPQCRKAYPVPLTCRAVSIGKSESESEEVAQYAEINQNMDLVNVRIMTVRNKETVLGSSFSRFQFPMAGAWRRCYSEQNRYNPF